MNKKRFSPFAYLSPMFIFAKNFTDNFFKCPRALGGKRNWKMVVVLGKGQVPFLATGWARKLNFVYLRPLTYLDFLMSIHKSKFYKF